MRIKLIALTGALLMALAAIAGSGAFTAITAERTASVEVVGDEAQLLQLQPADSPNSQYVTTEGGTVAIDVSNPEFGAEGVGADAVTRIDRMIRVTNHGTQPIALWTTDESDATTFFVQREAGGSQLTIDGETNAIGLESGESMLLGVIVGTEGIDPGTKLLESVQIHASSKVEPRERQTFDIPTNAQSLSVPLTMVDDLSALGQTHYGIGLSHATTFCEQFPAACQGFLPPTIPPIFGSPEMMVGAPGNFFHLGSGAAYLLHPEATVTGQNIVNLTTANAAQVEAELTGADGEGDAGESVALVGDVNGDGNKDYLIGDPFSPTTPAPGGEAHLIYGPVSGTKNLSTADATFTGDSSGDIAARGIGASVAGVGDVNNDGFDDILIGAPTTIRNDIFENRGLTTGAAFLFYGGNGSDLISGQTPVENADSMILEVEPRPGLGAAVAAAGDVNDDGYDDFLVGAPRADTGISVVGPPPQTNKISDAGNVTLVYGPVTQGRINLGFTNFDTNQVPPSSTQFDGATFYGAASDDLAGTSIAGTGDFNDDGFSDIVIGVPGDESVAIFYGGNGTAKLEGEIEISKANVSFDGSSVRGVGESVDLGGDTNGDGTDDILIGAPDNQSGTGAAYVVQGGSQSGTLTLPTDADIVLVGANESDHVGSSVAFVGDVDSDFDDDMLIGAPWESVDYSRTHPTLADNDEAVTDADYVNVGAAWLVTGDDIATGSGIDSGAVAFVGTANETAAGTSVDGED